MIARESIKEWIEEYLRIYMECVRRYVKEEIKKYNNKGGNMQYYILNSPSHSHHGQICSAQDGDTKIMVTFADGVVWQAYPEELIDIYRPTQLDELFDGGNSSKADKPEKIPSIFHFGEVIKAHAEYTDLIKVLDEHIVLQINSLLGKIHNINKRMGEIENKVGGEKR